MNNVFKTFAKYVSLNIIGMIGLSCYILADTFFVSKSLGANGLAALNFSISVYSVLNGVGLMIGIGGATRFALTGGGNKNGAFVNSLKIGGVFALIFVAMGAFFVTPLAKMLGAGDDTLHLTTTYLRTILCFAPCFLLNNIVLAFVRSDKAPRLAMIAMLASSLSNVVLDYVFMFPLGMGMFGAAFATGLSPVISLMILSLHFVKKKNTFCLVRQKISAREFASITSLGFSSLIGELASAIALITFNLIILGIAGNVGVAAYGVIANIALIGVAIFTGLGQGVQPLASKFHAEGDKKSLAKLKRYSLITVIAIATLIYLGVFFLSDAIISAFNGENNAELVAIANSGIKVYFIGFFFAGVNIFAAALLSATQSPRRAIVISILRSCAIIVPACILLSALLGISGSWLSFALTEFIVLFVSLALMFSPKKLERAEKISERK